MQSGFHQLSPELVLEIFSHLEGEPATLFNLCLVCKDVLALAQPVLFSTFDQEEMQECSVSDKFVRTLLHRPDLAGKVKSVRAVQGTAYPFVQPLTKKDTALAIQHVSQSGIRKMKKFSKALKKGCCEAMLAVILVLCHNLRTLSFEVTSDEFESSYFYKLLDLAGSKGNHTVDRFQRLRSVTLISWGWSNPTFDVKWAAPLVRLSIPEIGFYGLSLVWDNALNGQARLLKKPSPRRIHFEHCEITDQALSTILFNCTEVRDIDIEWCDGTSSISFFTMESLVCSLRTQKDTLQRLRLDCRRLDDWDDYSVDTTSIGSLREFSKITHLALSGVYITGSNADAEGYVPPSLADMLPASLVELTLLGKVCCRNEMLKRLVCGGFRTQFPHLRRLRISEYALIETPIDEPTRHAYLEAGIFIGTTNTTDYDRTDFSRYDRDELLDLMARNEPQTTPQMN